MQRSNSTKKPLKSFKNDDDGHILIEPKTKTKKSNSMKNTQAHKKE
jgi:hypothetical protein